MTRSPVRVVADRGPDTAWIVNISKGGLAIEVRADRAPDLGETIVLEMPLGKSRSQVKTQCLVCATSGRGSRIRIAHCSFVDDSPLFRATVEASMGAWRHGSG